MYSMQLLFAGSLKVVFLLLVVGVMDDARAEILGDGKISLSFVEHFSQVCCVLLNMYVIPAC